MLLFLYVDQKQDCLFITNTVAYSADTTLSGGNKQGAKGSNYQRAISYKNEAETSGTLNIK
ncbi:hypothetical protein Desor_2298 [Desulfosporosinus orientis DSM 765]|uniref:Uncharacterized protein n=1 Tax=Desulfosporosinus orientis (strain ATCC 19365 / DSM 765 / NCIMB 8382 / VKM B-1628 / Singapore I) TaxID=768706 RepID=G7WBB3_DESOD|nr:hypothetical protein Desor_2298 [Desulfosporosinus orientis DSM 765]